MRKITEIPINDKPREKLAKKGVVHPREILSDTLTDRAAVIIFVHNHPENDVEPSETDKKITKQLCDAPKLLGKQVIDPIIVTNNEHFSFQSEGLLE